jgi:hypothetical protein
VGGGTVSVGVGGGRVTVGEAVGNRVALGCGVSLEVAGVGLQPLIKTSIDRMKNENCARSLLIDFKLCSPGVEVREIIIDNVGTGISQPTDHQ